MSDHRDDVALARRALALLDLTELGDDATDDDVLALCGRARSPHGDVAAVCVWPRHVALARRTLGNDSPVRIATVVNFPHGMDTIDEVCAETRQALADGTDEIDLVLPWRAFAGGARDQAGAMVAAVRDEVPEGKRLKVILETGELLTMTNIDAASRLAIRQGADFIKTSTGKTPNGASLEATELMLRAIHDADAPVGLKPSGGIRTLDDAAAYLAQADEIMGPGWVTPATFRFGASGLWNALVAAIEGGSGVRAEGQY
jgi:deoxyribose-phosphate aldolase